MLAYKHRQDPSPSFSPIFPACAQSNLLGHSTPLAAKAICTAGHYGGTVGVAKSGACQRHASAVWNGRNGVWCARARGVAAPTQRT